MNITGKKYGGRTKGTPNKQTKDLREWMTSFINKNTSQIEVDWQQLDPKDRIVLFEKLLKYTLPTLQAVSNSIDFDKMDDAMLDEIIKRLTTNHQE